MDEHGISFGLFNLKKMAVTRGSYLKNKQQRVNNNNERKSRGKHSDEEFHEEKYINSGWRMLNVPKAAGSRIYSGVKRLLHRVEKSRGVETIKDFLWGGYQKLPKPSSFPLFFACREPKVHQSFRDSHDFYSDTNGCYVWSGDDDRQSQTSSEEHASWGNDGHNGKNICGSFLNFGNIRNGSLISKDSEPGIGRDKHYDNRKPKVKPRHELQGEEASVASAKSRAETCIEFEQKLREIVMDHQNNLEDVLDIEEFLHCYSRLSCPFYIDMVNQFFMDICGEFLR